jgi:hypothetical protein
VGVRDAKAACVILGIADEVAAIIGTLQLTELDRIADRRTGLRILAGSVT